MKGIYSGITAPKPYILPASSAELRPGWASLVLC